MSTKTTATVTALAVLAAGGLVLRQADARSAAADELAALTATTKTLAEQVRQANIAPAATPTPVTPSAATAPTGPRSLPGPGEVASRDESRAFLREHPELYAAFAALIRGQLYDEHAELMRMLGLTDEQAERLVTVLAKGRTRAMGQHQFTLSERDFSSPREFGNEIRAVIGEDGYQTYRETNQRGLSKSFVSEMTKVLYATPTPFTVAQATDFKRLVDGVVADPAFGAPHAGHWRYFSPERWNRLVAEAAKTMSEPHLAVLRDMHAQSTYQQAQNRGLREYVERQKTSNPAKP